MRLKIHRALLAEWVGLTFLFALSLPMLGGYNQTVESGEYIFFNYAYNHFVIY